MDRYLFHLCPLLLRRGSVIEPGNYGRLVRRTGWDHGSAMRETVLEAVRAQGFAQRPSRLASVFCFARRDDALAFRMGTRGFGQHALYRVVCVEAEVPRHETDWRWVDPDMGTFPDISWAWRYWNGLPPLRTSEAAGSPIDAVVHAGAERREVLIGGPLAVEERLDEG